MAKRRAKKTSPLVELRTQLGSISISRLAALVDIPAATLRSVESGRRTFNPDLQKRMQRRGLEWQPKARRWVFAFHHETPLSLSLVEAFWRISSGGSALFQDLDVHAIIRRLIALMQGADPAAYRNLLLDVHDSLERLRGAYKVDQAKEEFQQTTLWFKLIENDAGGQRLARGYSWKNSPDPHRLFDFRDKQKSQVALEDEGENEGARERPTQPAA
jgi:hypothetical protein